MMVKVKNGDFVELDFVGRIKATGKIFDLTVKDMAENDVGRQMDFKPIIACIGSGQLIKGFEERLVGKEVGSEFEFDLPAEKAFGKKNPNLIQLVPLPVFKKNNVDPYPGQQLNVDGMLATVRSVSGGRVVLDFNHPLAGKELHYWVKIRKIINSEKKKIEAITAFFGVPCEVVIKSAYAEIKTKKPLPEQMQQLISIEINKHLKDIKIKFST